MKIEKIIKKIHEMDTEDLIILNNLYCVLFNYEGEVFNNDEHFFELSFSDRVVEAVRAVSHRKYKFHEDYVQFDGYGNLESFNYFEVKDLVDFPDVMAPQIKENWEEFKHLFE